MEASRLNLRHLRAFCEVAELGSISRAAERIHRSQPAVTQAIAKLETQISAALFERTGDGLFLTEPGQLFLRRVEPALRQIAQGARLTSHGGNKTQGDRRGSFDHLITSAQLRALVAVSKTGNFSLAARQLGMSQPALYRTARSLEKVSGTQFYEVVSQGVVLTRAAERLARFTRLAFSELEQGLEEIEDWKGKDTGHIVIGTLPLARTFVLPSAINALLAERPDVDFSVVDGPYDDLLHALRHGEIDMLIGALRDPVPVDDIVQQPLFEDQLAVVARPSHPLVGTSRLRLKDLTEFPWIVPRRGTPTRENFEMMFSGKDALRPRHVVEASSLILIRGLLADSDCLTLISAHQIRHEENLHVLSRLNFKVPAAPRRIGLTLRENWRPTASQQRMIELLKQAGQQVPSFLQ